MRNLTSHYGSIVLCGNYQYKKTQEIYTSQFRTLGESSCLRKLILEPYFSRANIDGHKGSRQME